MRILDNLSAYRSSTPQDLHETDDDIISVDSGISLPTDALSDSKLRFQSNRFVRFFSTGPDLPVLDDAKAVDDSYRRHRLAILLTTTIGYAFYYTCRLVLSVVRDPLISNGILTVEQTGTVGAAVFITYAIGKLTNGFIADHGNVRKLFSLGLMFSAIINLFMGSVSSFWLFFLAWAVNGWFQAFGAPSCGVSLVNWFSNRERGRYYSVWNASMPAGEAITYAGTASLVTILGWRAGFLVPGVTCIIVAIVAYAFMRDRPQTLALPTIQDWKNDHGEVLKGSDSEPASTSSLQKEIFKLPRLWLLTIAAGFLYVTRYAISGWSIFFLQEARGLSLASAGATLGIGTVSGVVGGLVFGFVSDKLFKARRPPVTALFGFLELIVLCLIFFYSTTSLELLTLLFVLHGFLFGGLMVGILLFGMDIMPKKAIGAASGIIGVGSYFAAAATEHISGYLIGLASHEVNGVVTYDFTYAIVFWLGSMAMALLVASCLWNVKFAD